MKTVETVSEADRDLSDSIKKLIIKLGILPNLKGFSYIIQCVLISLSHPDYLDGGVTKLIYPEVGKKFNTTGERVERSVRHAISKAWAGSAFEYFYLMAEIPKDLFLDKPSNRFFLTTLCGYIKTRDELN